MKVRFSASARRYLRSETAYLRQYSASAAENFIAQIDQAKRNLTRFPGLGRGIDRLPMPDLHRLVVGNYLIDYQVGRAEIVIQTIRHGRQQPPEDIDPELDYEAQSDTSREEDE
jgi:plasmid stabilization system protein ParE